MLKEVGDCYEQFMVRMLEMRESIDLKQALDGIEAGPIMGNAGKVFKPAKAEAYSRVKKRKGELGFISWLTATWRIGTVRPPSFINLTVLQDMAMANQVADAVIILGSIDIVLGEVDR